MVNTTNDDITVPKAQESPDNNGKKESPSPKVDTSSADIPPSADNQSEDAQEPAEPKLPFRVRLRKKLNAIKKFIFSRRFQRAAFFAVSSLMFLTVIVYLWSCLQVERTLKEETIGIINHLNGQGFTIKYDNISSTYHPVKSGIVINNLSFSPPDFLGRWKWEIGKLAITSFPLTKNIITIDAKGIHQISGIGSSSLRFASKDLIIRMIKTDEGKLKNLSGQLDYSVIFAPVEIRKSNLSSIKFTLSAEQDNRFNFSFKLRDFAFVDKNAQIQLVDSLKITGAIKNLAIKNSLAGSIINWQKEGGNISLKNILLSWPPFSLTGTASISLDGRMQPRLRGTARIKNFINFINVLEKYGIAKKKDVNVMQIVHGDNASKSTESYKIPISISANRIYLGDLPLITFKELPFIKLK